MSGRRPALLTHGRAALLCGALCCALSACSTTTTGVGSNPGSLSQTVTAVTPARPAPVSSTITTTAAAIIAAPSVALRTATVTSRSGVVYPISVWAEKSSDTDCAHHAFGPPVIAYLIAHPCRGMGRLLATTTVNGKAVGLSQISISFLGGAPANYGYADRFQTLVRQDGTGNVNDLLREGYRLPSGPTSVPSPDAFTTVGQDAVATIYDIWYLDEPTPNNDPRLVALAQDIFLQY